MRFSEPACYRVSRNLQIGGMVCQNNNILCAAPNIELDMGTEWLRIFYITIHFHRTNDLS